MKYVALVTMVIAGCASLRSKVDEAYAQGNYTVEEAATCAYRDATQAPAAAHAALATLLGGDEPFVAPLLAR